MKILESKFFIPRKHLVTKYIGDNTHVVLEDIKHEDWKNSKEPYSELLTCLLQSMLHRSQLVIKETSLKDFEQCDDFHAFTYSKTLEKVIESELCFFHKEWEIFIVLTSNLSLDYDKEIFEEGLFRVVDVFYDNMNPNHSQHIPLFFKKYLFKYLSPKSKISLLVKEGDNIQLNEYTIKPYAIDFERMYHEDFLAVSQHIKEYLHNENKGIVLLHGEPGTGKTNYIKWLTSQIPHKKFIFVPTTLIASMTEPYFINFLIENKNSILIFEDCENYISERDNTNAYTDVVASILNLADGILSDVVECQIICTFNAEINQIDHALLRKGRLIAEYAFKALPAEQVNRYFQSKNIDATTQVAMPLSEMVNFTQEAFKEKEKSDRPIGFSLN